MTENTTHTSQDDWETHWEEYQGVSSRNPAQIYRQHLAELLLERRGTPERLVDIGSGTGEFAAVALKRWPGASVLGLEYAASGVAISERKLPAARFQQADLIAPGAAPNAEDRGWGTHALCSEVLEHVDDPTLLIATARQWLAPGARLVVTVPGGPMSAFDRHIGHRQHFTPTDLAGVLEAAGYSVLDVGGAGFPFFNLYRTAVISRGEQLIDDASSPSMGGGESLFAKTVMAGFGAAFKLNLTRSPYGWQTWAVAQA